MMGMGYCRQQDIYDICIHMSEGMGVGVCPPRGVWRFLGNGMKNQNPCNRREGN